MDREAGSASPARSESASRYVVEALLGQGGMAVVHRVLDRASGRRMAQKRLRPSALAESREKMVALFEREYLTLIELKHPRVVEAYDYGVDELGPYYTMELLDGGDLQGLSPLPWQRACAFARDVCSALALLHSRRLVYRDLSPRNVRCTSDGLAKLIDFGALAPMGPSRELVGTLPFVPPEALHQQPLDARTDLYALGATLYHTLVQRNAYPARDVVQLRDFWRSRPRRPSELVAGIPEALDRLVMDLMQLDPSLRPANAAEVMARLGAVAGLRSSEHRLVSQAYLSNPTLVGRADTLAQARKLMLRALHRRGVALMIRGAPGLGRSRLLDAWVLEAKLAGLTVLRADASDAQSGSHGVLRVLASQLLGALGARALESAEAELALLGHAIPELVRHRADVVLAPSDDPQHHRRVQQALRQWLLACGRQRPLLIAIDDLPRIDEPSAACVALLAQELTDHGIVVATTASEDDIAHSPVRSAVDLLAESSMTFVLAPLAPALTEQLLRSVFDEVPNLPLLARYVQGVTGGNPRDIMRLAQHLVSEEVVRYEGGAWSLPAQLGTASLPRSMADALSLRVARLSEEARQLALALALEPKQTFSFEDCAQLVGAGNMGPRSDAAQVLAWLDDLVAEEVLLYAGERYTLRHASWMAPLVAAVAPASATLLHLRLAALFEQRGDEFRAAQHLLSGGERERGLDLLLTHAVQSEQRTDTDAGAFAALLSALPADWLRTYELGLRLCELLGRPKRQRDMLLSRIAGLVANAVADTDGYVHIESRIAQLRRDSGLDDLAALPSTVAPELRLKAALGAAAERYHALPEGERVHDPGTAIKHMAKAMLAALGTISFTLDHAAWSRLPSLVPLTALSPALSVVQRLSEGVGARVAGQSEASIAIYESLLARIAEPDRAGLTPVHHLSTQLRVQLSIGTLEAAMGLPSSLERAKQIEAGRMFAAQGMFIRHIFHVWQGDVREAARCRQQIEVVRLESNAQYGFEGQHLLTELAAYAFSDDLTRVKHATEAVEPRARIHQAWAPVLRFGRGEYHRIRGDREAALREHEAALAHMPDGRHQVWVHTAAALLRTLVELGRHAEARVRGEAFLAQAAALGLGYAKSYLRMPLSLALRAVGAHAEAERLAEQVIEELSRLGSTGLLLSVAYETRARIALSADDPATFERYAALSTEQWRGAARRLAGARVQHLVETGSEADPSVLDEVSIISQFTSTLENCQTPNQRARCGLEFLGRQSGASAGLLYSNTTRGLVLSASYGEVDASRELDEWASQYFLRELEESDDTALFSGTPEVSGADERRGQAGQRYVPVLLTHQAEQGLAITGLAVLITISGAPFTYPSRLAAELSRSVASAGDVELVYT